MKKLLRRAALALPALLLASAFAAGPSFAARSAQAAEPSDAEEAVQKAEAPASSAAALAPFSLGAAVDERYDRGIALTYRLEFEKAEAELRAIIALDTANPAGYFALAALSWWRYSQNFDVKADFKALEDEGKWGQPRMALT